MSEILTLASTILIFMASSGVIFLGLSSWIGKIWAEKIMASNKADHDKKLAELRANLQRENHFDLEKLKAELSISQQRDFQGFKDKLEIYRMVVDTHADFLHDLQLLVHLKKEITPDKLETFDKLRMKTYGYLAMISPQDVIDAHEELVECIFYVLEGKDTFDWQKIREKILSMLNAARKDIGLNTETITYNGNR